MHFIKLTEWKDLVDTFINAEKVREITGTKDQGTRVHFDDGFMLYVTETAEEIMEKL